MRIIEVKDRPALEAIEDLAEKIWIQHYTPIIGEAQVRYMLDKFQSLKAMQAQISEGYHYVQILEEETLLGYLAYEQRERTLFLSKLYIDSDQRGRGIGRKALDWLQLQAKDTQCDGIELTVNKYNADSIAIYEQLGFVKVKPVVFDIGGGFIMDDYLLRLNL